MKKLILCASVVALGMMYSCTKDEVVPEGSTPEWLGESIYSELENPTNLEGTFTTYMKLVDDLGYKDVLSKTGSKTIFPANDEAFARFFASNDWNVTDYSQLSTAQKKVLFYNSMLDNSILINMLSNVTGGSTTVVNDIALKHASNISVIDTVTALHLSDIPANNSYWNKMRAKFATSLNSYIVEDNTKPQIVHFTKNFLINKGITTSGPESDFAIITGEDGTSNDNAAYVFNDKIIKSDVTCKNGYIHQVQDVLVQPGNMASVLRQEANTRYYSRILDYFSAPYYDASTTSSYNASMRSTGGTTVDSIFQWRYISKRSQGGSENLSDPSGNQIASTKALKFDPGWNAYYPDHKNSGTVDYSLADIGTMFVPTDDALWYFFQPSDKNSDAASNEEDAKGTGAYILEYYMKEGGSNTLANFAENLDSLQSKNPGVLIAFVNNLMQTEFTGSVPSKFSTLTNDATENLGMNTSLLQKKEDGKYDIKICNNGVIYKINKVIAPDEYTAVLAPASIYDDLRVMNWAIQDRNVLGLDFKFYLLAMKAKYALLLPDDEAFSNYYYINPCSWLHDDGAEALRFYYDNTQKDDNKKLRVEVHKYNKQTNTVDPAIVGDPQDASVYKTQLADILNTHTILLDNSETFGANHYYMSKSGAGIYVDKAAEGGNIYSGMALYNGVKSATIKHDWTQKNGHTYRLDSPIQPTMNSVYSTLNPKTNGGDDRFDTFFEYINFFGDGSRDILKWAGISDDLDEKTNTYPTDRYKIFCGYTTEANRQSKKCLDYNVRLFNTYNYTIYAPNNDAMKYAFDNMGLPTLDDMNEIWGEYGDEETKKPHTDEETEIARAKLLNMIQAAQKFIRYHMQAKSVFCDNNGSSFTDYSSLYTNEVGVAEKLTVETGDNRIVIKDVYCQNQEAVTKSHQPNLWKYVQSGSVNLLTRDWEFDKKASEATSISTSSYAVIHELTTPLCATESGRYDDAWRSAAKQAYYGKNYATLVKSINTTNQNY